VLGTDGVAGHGLAAAMGDTNTCASKAADAREMVLELKDDYRHKSDAVEMAGGESDAMTDGECAHFDCHREPAPGHSVCPEHLPGVNPDV